MKILLIGEFSGLQNELKQSLLDQGHSVTLAAASDFWKMLPADISLGHGSNIYSYKIRQLLLPITNAYKFQGFDVVHLVNFYTIPRLPILNLLFVKWLRKNNGIITLAAAGDDPFFVKYSEKTLRYSPIPSHEIFDRNKKYYMRGKHHLDVMNRFMNYIDGVIPTAYEYYSTFKAAGYSEITALPIPIPINLDNIKLPAEKKTNKVVFFHGLNRPGFKGTFIIEKVFKQISEKYTNDVECYIKGRMPIKDYLNLLGMTDISVDQLYSFSLGLNALYSMALKKIVVGGVEPESSILYGGILPPAFNAYPSVSELKITLEQFLDLRSEFEILKYKSREFVSLHHNPQIVSTKYIKYWESISRQ